MAALPNYIDANPAGSVDRGCFSDHVCLINLANLIQSDTFATF
jgi:hypothetical protein